LINNNNNNNNNNNKPQERNSERYKTEDIIEENLKGRWQGKRMCGPFPRSLDENQVDKEQSYGWVKFGDMKGETESAIVAAQDKAIGTNYYKHEVLEEGICSLKKVGTT
jgi:hypothetical protein